MLSNPTSSIHARQRQHRRQNSTPSAYEGVKIQNLPNANAQRQAAGAHRRGLSLDTRRQQPTTTRQDLKVRMSTNYPGLASTSQHNILREAQQQRIQARPGTHQQQQQAAHFASMAPSDSENSYLLSPHATPQTQRFESASCFDASAIPFDPFGTHLHMMLQKNQESYASNLAESKSFEFFTNDSALSTPTFMNFEDSPTAENWSAPEESSRRSSSRRISDGIMDRVNKYETLVVEEAQGPATPPSQNANSKYFRPRYNYLKLWY